VTGPRMLALILGVLLYWAALAQWYPAPGSVGDLLRASLAVVVPLIVPIALVRWWGRGVR